MKKQTHQQIIEFYKDLLPRYRQELLERQRQADHIMVWLTAISTGAIALILSQSANLNINDPIYLKVTITLLLLSIVFCVTFRAFYYPLEGLETDNLLYFEGYCYGVTAEFHGPRDIDDAHTIQDIADYLKKDMGLDYDHWLEHDYLNRDFWVDHYNNWAKFWGKSEEEGLEQLSKAIAILNNENPEKAINIFKEKERDDSVRKKIIKYKFICNWSYQLSLIFFVLSVISVTIGYICN